MYDVLLESLLAERLAEVSQLNDLTYQTSLLVLHSCQAVVTLGPLSTLT